MDAQQQQSLCLRTLKNHNLSLPLSSLNCRWCSTTTGLCPKSRKPKGWVCSETHWLCRWMLNNNRSLYLRTLKNHNLSFYRSALNCSISTTTGLCPKKSRKLKAEFAPKLTDLQLDAQKQAQHQREFVWKSRKLKSEFAAQLTEFGRCLRTKKRLNPSESGKVEFEFSAQLSKLESDAQTQKELTATGWGFPISEPILEVQQKCKSWRNNWILKSSHPQLFLPWLCQPGKCVFWGRENAIAHYKQLKFSLTTLTFGTGPCSGGITTVWRRDHLVW